MKVTIISRNFRKVTRGGKFFSAASRKGAASNSICSQFCSCWMHKTCKGMRGKLKEDSETKCQTNSNQQAGIAEDCPGIELDRQSLEIEENFCYLGDTQLELEWVPLNVLKDQEWVE